MVGRPSLIWAAHLDDSIAHLPEKERRARVVAQLSRVFGKEAENYLDYKDTFWADEEFTMPSGNVGRLSRHKNNGHSAYSNVYMGGSLYIGGTETSSHAGGYMEGAVTSAANIAKRIKDDLSSTSHQRAAVNEKPSINERTITKTLKRYLHDEMFYRDSNCP